MKLLSKSLALLSLIFMAAFASAVDISDLTINNDDFVGGTNVVLKVKLHAAAPAGGQVVNLSSTVNIPDLPATVTVPAGATIKAFSITPSGVDLATVGFVSANTPGAFVSAQFTVEPAVMTSFTISPNSVPGGVTTTGVVNLNGWAGPSGFTVNLGTNSSKVELPASVSVPYNSKTKAFAIITGGVAASTSTTESADGGGVHLTAGLNLTKASLLSLTTNVASVVGGGNVVLTAKLNGVAPQGGLNVALTGDPALHLPDSIFVAYGKSAAAVSFNPAGVDSNTHYTITGAYDGVNRTANLDVNQAAFVSIGFSPPVITGGNVTSAFVKFNGLTGPSGAVVMLSSLSAFIDYSPSVTVPAQTKTYAWAMKTAGVRETFYPKLYGTYNGVELNATLTVLEAVAMQATCSPNTTPPNKTVQVTLRLNGLAANPGRQFTVSYSGNAGPTGPSTCLVLPGRNAVAINVNSGTAPAGSTYDGFVTFTGPDGDTVQGSFSVTG